MSLDFKDFLKRQKCFCLRLCFPVCYVTLSVKLGTTSLDTWLAKSIDVLRTTSVAFPARHLYSALRHCGYGARYHVATWCDAASPAPCVQNASQPPRSVREASRAGRAGHQRAVPPQPAQLCPGYPAAAEGGTPARLAPRANPPGISPAHQLPSLGGRGGCKGLFPTATWRKNTEKVWRNEIQKNYMTWGPQPIHFIQEMAKSNIYTEEAFLRTGSF